MKSYNFLDSDIAILWFGKEWQSTLRFLAHKGVKKISIIDQKLTHEEIQSTAKSIYKENIDIYTWSSITDGLEKADIIFKSPWVSPFQEMLLPYREKYISQTEVFFSFYNEKVIGITGTKGKSTISTLTYHILQQAGYNVKLVGNIGTPVLDEIHENDTYDYIIYEMSSYMLQDFIPHLFIGLFNNIYECHLDWHQDSFSVYKNAKLNILRDSHIQIIHDKFISDTDIQTLSGEKHSFGNIWNFTVWKTSILYKENDFIDISDIALEGRHNLENICWVLELLSHIIEDTSILQEVSTLALKSFAWLPHRTQHIANINGIDFIDDAIATTPESTIAAIDTFDGSLDTLLLWGEDSGFEFQKIRQRIIDSSISYIVAFPETSEKIFPEISSYAYWEKFSCTIDWKEITFLKTKNMQEWVEFAFQSTTPGKKVLLSSAAPSFSVWKNYLEKAQQFHDAVLSLKK